MPSSQQSKRTIFFIFFLVAILFLIYIVANKCREPYSAFCDDLCKVGVPASCQQLSGPGSLGKSVVCAADEASLLACNCPVPPADRCPQILGGGDISCADCQLIQSDEFSVGPMQIDRLCANLPNDAQCSFDEQCQSGGCGRKTAAEGDEGNYVCCPSGTDLFDGHDYCKGLPNGSVCKSDAMCATDYCDGSNGMGARGTCQNKPQSSCFLAHALVETIDLEDGSVIKKRIDQVKVGDLVRSGRTGEPVQVMLVDRAERLNVLIVGVNDHEPFATADHSFIGVYKPRVCADVGLALSLKHYDPEDVGELRAGSRLYGYGDCKHEYTVDRVSRVVMSDCVVYNLITSDHSYVINGFAVNDDFPEVEKHPRVSLRILNILADMAETGEYCETVDLGSYVRRVCASMSVSEDESVKDEDMMRCMDLLINHPRLIQIADELWEKWFDQLNV